MKAHFRLDTHPLADPANVVQGDSYRITVLDAGLVRLEYSESGAFEDRASQMAVDRAFPAADFTVTETGGRGCEIHTDRLHLIYDKGPFTTHGLSVQAKGGYHSDRLRLALRARLARTSAAPRAPSTTSTARSRWRTACSPATASRWSTTPHTVLLEDDGWIAPAHAGQPRPLRLRLRPRLPRRPAGALHAHRPDTRCCPATPSATGGAATTPTPPTSTSAWWTASAPRACRSSVAVHRHGLAPGRHRPALRQRLDRLHLEHRPVPGPASVPRRAARARARGLAQRAPGRGRARARDGLRRRSRERMGIDPDSELPGHLRPDRPRLPGGLPRGAAPPARGARASTSGGWTGSRAGSPRSPASTRCGCSTTSTSSTPAAAGPAAADVLALRRDRQPPLPDRASPATPHHLGVAATSSPTSPRPPPTPATAGGATTSAATSRATATTSWPPAGCSSGSSHRSTGCTPASTRSTPRSRGGSPRAAEQVMTDFLRLRHQLLPYLATMNLRAHADGEPIVQPMYYDHPDEPAAYDVPNQFMFGSELLVAPITSPADPATGLGRVKAWLPEGTWTDVFTGQPTPAAARSTCTATCPRSRCWRGPARSCRWCPPTPCAVGTALPSVVEVRVYPGADGELTLAEDPDDDRWARTRITYDDTPARSRRARRRGRRRDPAGRPDLPRQVAAPTADADERVFALLDRAQIGFELKASAYDAVRGAADAGSRRPRAAEPRPVTDAARCDQRDPVGGRVRRAAAAGAWL